MIQGRNGSVRCFGYNPWGQCGVDPESDNSGRIKHEEVLEFNLVPVPHSVDIDTGLQHCISLSIEGHIYTWGKGQNGQLGHGIVEASHIPRRVNIENKCTKISAGFSHSAAICEQGKIYIWGKGLSEQRFSDEEQGTVSRKCFFSD